ncbi:MAG TPA: DUF1802 family protein [Thermoanaerobaculia bacterium]|nr:DUF1802 family protein [Thermoanaerobaculia bacterium]
MKIPNHTALKEWASVVAAIGAGEQILLLRKGGIADPKFGVDADRFHLFPTYLHQKEKLFQPQRAEWFRRTDRDDPEPPEVEIDTWVEVVETFQIRELDRLLALEPFLIFTRETIEERYRFRPEQAVHVIAVRGWKLPRPAAIRADRPEYRGCVSWISLEEEIPIDGSTRAMPEETLRGRIDEVVRALKAVPGAPLTARDPAASRS